MKRIDDDVLAVLSGCKVEGRLVTILAGQLPRPLYTKVDKVLRALGGKWDRKARAHVFTDEPAPVLERAILTSTYEKATAGGWFPTPPDVAEVVLAQAALHPSLTVLEPSAGDGALVRAIVRRVPQVNVLAIENDPGRAARLREQFTNVEEGDFLAKVSPANHFTTFDRVVMNPPFERLADIQHVRHAWDFLQPGGRLVAIMSPGWTFRQERLAQDFRTFVATKTKRRVWTMLPEGAFRPSGTLVRAGFLILDKAVLGG